MADSLRDENKQCFSQHSVNYVYCQLLELSKYRRRLRKRAAAKGAPDDAIADCYKFDLSYRHINSVTNALLVQLEQRLTFESILIFRALAEVELEEDRCFNDPRWFKHFLFNTARGMIGFRSDYTNIKREKLNFILNILSLSVVGGSSNISAGLKAMKPEGTHHSLSKVGQKPSFCACVNILVENSLLKLKLSPLTDSKPSSSCTAFSFFTVDCKSVGAMLEVNDYGAAIPSVICETSVHSVNVSYNSPRQFSRFPLGGTDVMDLEQYQLKQPLLCLHHEGSANASAAFLEDPFTGIEMPYIQAELHRRASRPFFFMRVNCGPANVIDNTPANGRTFFVDVNVEIEAVDVFITPLCGEITRAFSEFTLNATSNVDEMSGKFLSSNHKAYRNDNTMMIDKSIVDDILHMMTVITNIEVIVLADIKISPMHLVFYSCNPTAVDSCVGTSPNFTKQCDLGSMPPKKVKENQASVLVFNSGSVQMTIGDAVAREAEGLEMCFLVTDAHVFAKDCDCSRGTTNAILRCTCWHSLSAEELAVLNLLHPVNVSLKVQMQERKVSKSYTGVLSPSLAISNHISEVTVSLSQIKMEKILTVMDSIRNASFPKTSYSRHDVIDARDRSAVEENNMKRKRDDVLLADVVEGSDFADSNDLFEETNDNDYYSLNSSVDYPGNNVSNDSTQQTRRESMLSWREQISRLVMLHTFQFSV